MTEKGVFGLFTKPSSFADDDINENSPVYMERFLGGKFP